MASLFIVSTNPEFSEACFLSFNWVFPGNQVETLNSVFFGKRRSCGKMNESPSGKTLFQRKNPAKKDLSREIIRLHS